MIIYITEFLTFFIIFLIFILFNNILNEKIKQNNNKNRHYIIKKKVLKGFNLANKLGWKTANINLSKEFKCGMYSVETNFGEGILVIYKNKQKNLSIGECHILNFNKNIYNEYLYIYKMQKINFNHGLIHIFNNNCD